MPNGAVSNRDGSAALSAKRAALCKDPFEPGLLVSVHRQIKSYCVSIIDAFDSFVNEKSAFFAKNFERRTAFPQMAGPQTRLPDQGAKHTLPP